MPNGLFNTLMNSNPSLAMALLNRTPPVTATAASNATVNVSPAISVNVGGGGITASPGGRASGAASADATIPGLEFLPPSINPERVSPQFDISDLPPERQGASILSGDLLASPLLWIVGAGALAWAVWGNG